MRRSALPPTFPCSRARNNARPFTLPDESTTQQDDHAAKFGSVSPLYFEALKIPVVKGRVFTPYDNMSAPKVAVVNEAFAAQVLAGIAISLGGDSGAAATTSNSRSSASSPNVRENGLDAEPAPRVYFSMLAASHSRARGFPAHAR